MKILDALDEVAKRNDATPATIAHATRIALSAADVRLLDDASAWRK